MQFKTAARATWLHISDLHFKVGDPYDRNVVLNALIKSFPDFHKRGVSPDAIFITGDIANSGARDEYDLVGAFLDQLLRVSRVPKERLFIVPGNHDVDRSAGLGLSRTLNSREEIDQYFGINSKKPHIENKQSEFSNWYDRYFEGIREFNKNGTCGTFENINLNGVLSRS
jgi:metallophosphoesterase superfamily enzyme